METEPFSLAWFLGAVAIFLFGIRISRIGLQLWGGDRLRKIIASLTENRWMAVGVGAFVTLILQSSSATANMLVSFAGAGLMNLPQAMGVLLGADIGTAFVVVLLSIRKTSEYAMFILIFGVLMEMLSKRKKSRNISMIFIGFGFIFLGLHLLSVSAKALAIDPFMGEVVHFFSRHPSYSFCLAALFTPFFSSAGMIGLVIAFGFSGLLTFEAALPYVLGANVGTCFTSFFSSLSGSSTGKQVALSHLLLKTTGVLLFLPFLDSYAWGIDQLATKIPGLQASISSRVALSHILFNFTISILFLPLISQGAWLIEKIIPSRSPSEKRFAPRYLTPRSLETPPLAFANVKREILRVADLVQDMFRESLRCYEKTNPDLAAEIESRDDQVDVLDREIKLFLAKLSQENLTDEQAKLSITLLSITGSLEEIGDIVSQNILDMAARKNQRGTDFSAEGWSEIQDYHQNISDCFTWMSSALASGDQELVHKVLRKVEHLAKKNEDLRAKHLARLQAGLKESFETSSIHLDTLSAFSRIASLLADLVRPILEVRL